MSKSGDMRRGGRRGAPWSTLRPLALASLDLHQEVLQGLEGNPEFAVVAGPLPW